MDLSIKDFLKNFLLFSILTPDQLTYIIKYMDSLELKAGEILFKEGDAGDFMCIVLDGGLEIIKQDTWKDQADVIATLGQGNSVGEMSLIEHTPRSATVRAVSNTHLTILSQGVFDMIIDKEPDIGIKMLKGLTLVLSENLRDTSSRLADELAA